MYMWVYDLMIRVIEAHQLECYFEVKSGYIIFFGAWVLKDNLLILMNFFGSLNLEFSKEGLMTIKEGLMKKTILRSVYIIYKISYLKNSKLC